MLCTCPSNSSPKKKVSSTLLSYIIHSSPNIIHISSLIILGSILFDNEFLYIIIKEAGLKRNGPKIKSVFNMLNISPIANKLGQGHMIHLSNKGLAHKLNRLLISMILTTVHNHIPQTNKP